MWDTFWNSLRVNRSRVEVFFHHVFGKSLICELQWVSDAEVLPVLLFYFIFSFFFLSSFFCPLWKKLIKNKKSILWLRCGDKERKVFVINHNFTLFTNNYRVTFDPITIYNLVYTYRLIHVYFSLSVMLYCYTHTILLSNNNKCYLITGLSNVYIQCMYVWIHCTYTYICYREECWVEGLMLTIVVIYI